MELMHESTFVARIQTHKLEEKVGGTTKCIGFPLLSAIKRLLQKSAYFQWLNLLWPEAY